MRGLGIVAVVCLTLTVSGARAQDTPDRDERARTHFDAGLLHYQEGAYDRALVEFRRSWELSQRPVLLINLATVKERLGMYTEAATDLREFLRVTPDAEDRERLERRIENLERLERERAGSEGAASERTEPTREVASPSEATPPAPSGPDDGLLAGAIAGYAIAGAGAALMGIFGGLALGEESSLASGCGAAGTCSDAQVADANTFALVSDVGLGVALAGAATGTVLLVMALTGDRSGSETASVTPWLAPDSAGISTRVRF